MEGSSRGRINTNVRKEICLAKNGKKETDNGLGSNTGKYIESSSTAVHESWVHNSMPIFLRSDVGSDPCAGTPASTEPIDMSTGTASTTPKAVAADDIVDDVENADDNLER